MHQVLVGLPQGVGGLPILFYFNLIITAVRERCHYTFTHYTLVTLLSVMCGCGDYDSVPTRIELTDQCWLRCVEACRLSHADKPC
jgi:hypothetical protein